MAGEIEEPFRLNFQADSLHSGSISFGRFENEALCWERRSSFSHNRYLEEVEKCSKPGLVFEKKAYFEAQFSKKGILGILGQSSPDSQNEKEYQKSELDPNESHSAHFDVIENEVTQFEKEVFERSTSERQIEFKYDSHCNDTVPENVKVEESQTDRTGDVISSDSTPLFEMKENLDGESANSNISAYTKHEAVENSCGSSKEKVLLEAEMTKPVLKPRLGVAKTKRYIPSEESKGSKIKPGEKVNDVIQRSKNDTRKAEAAIHNEVQMQKTLKHETGSRTKGTKEIRSSSKEPKESGSRTVGNPQSCTTQPKASSRMHQTSIRKSAISETMPVKKQDSSRPGLKTGEKPCKNVTQVHQLHAKAQPMNGAIKQLSKSLNFKATPMPSFYSRPLRDTDRNKGMVTSIKQRKPLTSSISTGTKVSKKTELRTGEERAQAISIAETRKTDIDSQQQALGTMSCHSTVTSDSNPSSPAAPSTSNNSLAFSSNRLVGVKKEQVEKHIILRKNKVLEGNQMNKMKTMQGKQKPRSGISSGTINNAFKK